MPAVLLRASPFGATGFALALRPRARQSRSQSGSDGRRPEIGHVGVRIEGGEGDPTYNQLAIVQLVDIDKAKARRAAVADGRRAVTQIPAGRNLARAH